ncbi:MAG: anti-sigma F factor [Lachnospiraceae bacterium]|nr:anti-sigma F factor [Lachnospiraceae bacterium]
MKKEPHQGNASHEGITRNEMELCFDAVSSNEGFARVAVAAFISHLNPTVEEMSDVKTAVSEAVTNSIIHGYENIYGYGKHAQAHPEYLRCHPGKVRIVCVLERGILHIEVQDQGKGIEDVDKAMEPLYTTRPELERSGMGFAFMEAFMDELEVESEIGKGTIVRMKKKLGVGSWIYRED